MIDHLRDGIEFYQNYYKYDLLIALTFTMVGWIIILCQYVLTAGINFVIKKRVILIGTLAAVIIVIFNMREFLFINFSLFSLRFIFLSLLSQILSWFSYFESFLNPLVQRTPTVVILYFILPIPIWMVVLKDNSQISAVKKLITSKTLISCIILCLLVAEVSVYSFFQRKVLSAALFSYSLIITIVTMRRKIGTKMKIVKYFSSSVCLGIFPLLPIVEKDTKGHFLLWVSNFYYLEFGQK